MHEQHPPDSSHDKDTPRESGRESRGEGGGEGGGLSLDSLEMLQRVAEHIRPDDPAQAEIPLQSGIMLYPTLALAMAQREPIPITLGLLGLCLAMFGLTELLGSSTHAMTLYLMGANMREAVLGGETFRLLSAVFLHIGAAHLFSNLMGLYALGQTVERLYGRSRTLLIFLSSGMMGCIFSLLLHDGQAAGASGALFGYMGLMAVFPLGAGRVLPKEVLKRIAWSIVPWLAFNLVLTFTSSRIDVGGHLGGLLCGAVLGLTLRAPTLNPWARSSLIYYGVAGVVFIVVGLLALQYGFWWRELLLDWPNVRPLFDG